MKIGPFELWEDKRMLTWVLRISAPLPGCQTVRLFRREDDAMQWLRIGLEEAIKAVEYAAK